MSNIIVNGSNIDIEVTNNTNVSIETDVVNIDVQPSVIYVNNSSVQPLRYKAILSQSGTNNPIPVVLENTISSDLEWEFVVLANYRLKSNSMPSGLFTLGKTFLYVSESFEGHSFKLTHSSSTGIPNDNNIRLTNSNAINSFTYLSVLIEIYP